MEAPVDVATMNCQALANIIRMTCEVNGRKITLIFDEFTNPSGAFSWTISGIKNPGSTKPSSPFAETFFVDAADYIVSSTDEEI